jgi:ketosteroid isomerase-like protein
MLQPDKIDIDPQPAGPMLRPMSAIQSIRSATVMLAAFSLPAIAAEPSPKRESTQEKAAVIEDVTKARLAELDAYWAEVSRAVREGDFKAYVATCHPEGVLVSGTKQMSQPLATALARWEKDFIATREGKVRGNVEFRFSRRLGDATTAHETGIFRYTSLEPGAPPKYEWMRLEALLVKRGETWKMLMENQIGPATQAEWDALE